MPLKIVMVVSEAVPFAKTGGLADVAGALPKALSKIGVDVTLVMPFYREVAAGAFNVKKVCKLNVRVGAAPLAATLLKAEMPDTAIKAYFISYDPYYDRDGLYQEKGIDFPDNAERFTLLCRGALEAIIHEKLEPDCIHIHDWQTGLIPIYLKELYRDELGGVGTVLTIHNIGYQGNFDKKYYPITNLDWKHFEMKDMEFFGQFSFLKAGIVHTEIINTVSERYAEEIQTPEFGFGFDGVLRYRKEDLYGVLNGIDYGVWNPAKDEYIAQKYTAGTLKNKAVCKAELEECCAFKHEPKVALVGIISRLADQKGFDIIVDGIDEVLQLPCRYVLLGTGDPKYHRLFEEIGKRHPRKFATFLKFDDKLAHKIYAGSDIFLMPSRYEPCGLGQLIAMAYGTITVGRATGGIADTVIDVNDNPKEGVGFTFERYTASAMVDALRRALSVYEAPRRWNTIIQRAMAKDFSWEASARKYVSLYKKAKKAAGVKQ